MRFLKLFKRIPKVHSKLSGRRSLLSHWDFGKSFKVLVQKISEYYLVHSTEKNLFTYSLVTLFTSNKNFFLSLFPIDFLTTSISKSFFFCTGEYFPAPQWRGNFSAKHRNELIHLLPYSPTNLLTYLPYSPIHLLISQLIYYLENFR